MVRSGNLAKLISLVLLGCMMILPLASFARDRVAEIELDDGSTVKVFLFLKPVVTVHGHYAF